MDNDADLFLKCESLVSEFFHGDPRKAAVWWNAKNPSIGGVAPIEMVAAGRAQKLFKFISKSLEENEWKK